jgi:HK97 family phage prohead protease
MSARFHDLTTSPSHDLTISPSTPMPTPIAPPELKFTPLDFKAVAADGAFEGYASLFDKEDLGRDVIAPGAFRDSLAARGPAGIKMLFQHKPDEPIGIWDSLREDARGLLARGRLMPEVARAREVLALMRAGALDGLSIGFRAVRGRRDARTGVRRLTKVDLWEISVVTFPLLPEARVAHVKSHDHVRLSASIAAATRLLRQSCHAGRGR